MSVNVSYKGTVHSYGVSRGMLVQNLKEEISSKQNLHQFQLMLGQAQLEDTHPVSKYLFTTFTLCYGNTKAAVEINDINLGVAVVNPDVQKVFTEKATPEMTVGELKERISRKLSSTQGKWTLKKHGEEVPDGDLLKTHLEVKTFTVKTQDMTVTLWYVERGYSVTTMSYMTVLDFKSLCCETIGVPVDSFLCMEFNGTYLNYSDDIDDPQWLKSAMNYYGDEAASVIEKMREEKRKADNRTLDSHGVKHDSTIDIIYCVVANF